MFFDFGRVDTSYWYFDDVIGRSPLVSTDEAPDGEGLRIFPNPTHDQLFVSIPAAFAQGEKVLIEIINLQGLRVFYENYPVETDTQVLHLPDLPAGQYLIKIKGERMYYVKPFVKIK